MRAVRDKLHSQQTNQEARERASERARAPQCEPHRPTRVIHRHPPRERNLRLPEACRSRILSGPKDDIAGDRRPIHQSTSERGGLKKS